MIRVLSEDTCLHLHTKSRHPRVYFLLHVEYGENVYHTVPFLVFIQKKAHTECIL